LQKSFSAEVTNVTPFSPGGVWICSRRKVGDSLSRQARSSMACTAAVASFKPGRFKNCQTASVPRPGRTSQAAGQAHAERPEMVCDRRDRADEQRDWLDKAIRIVEKQIQEMNRKQRGKEQSEMSLVQ
jgi:hypothetical protein